MAGSYLGVDVGTQGVKALVLDLEEGRIRGRGAAPLELLPVRRPGAAEQDPAAWLAAMEAAVRQALAASEVDPRALAGIGVSGQQHGLVALDEDLEVLRPAKLWCDTETAREAAELSRALGRPVPCGFTAPKVLWLRCHEPEQARRLRWALLPHDFVNLWLTGRVATEAGDASGTGYFNPRRRAWDPAALALLELEGRVPELVAPDEVLGRLRPEAAARLGLSPGLPVAPGSGDNMLSALGAGAVEAGILVVSLGTSGTLFTRTSEPILDPAGTVAPFCDATGGGLPLVCTLNCTTVTEEVRAAFATDLESLTAAAAAEPPGSHGLLFLPYLVGERTPDWPHASGTLLGLRPGLLRPGLLFRAALEGTTLALREGFAGLQEHGVQGREIRLVGGGARNPLWRRLVAAAFGLPVRLPREPESAALGAALQAAAVASSRPVRELVRDQGVPLAPETIAPEPALAAALEEARERFRVAGRALFAGGFAV